MRYECQFKISRVDYISCFFLFTSQVIPIESSMEGNRHLFPHFLHGAILILTTILGGFGVMGYIKYGK